MLTCGVWVKRGAAKEIPDKVTLEEEDLKQLVEETKNKLQTIEGNENIDFDDLAALQNGKDEENSDTGNSDPENIVEEEENDEDDETKAKEDMDEDDEAIRAEYGLDNYDEEGSVMTGAGLAGLMYFDSNEDDPYINIKDLDEDDRADSVIHKNDNLFVTGRMEEDYSSLDIYLYNEENDDLFVHHDILLESFPLCVEWLSFDPAEEGKPGNFLALGTMEPEIQVWDLDVIDTIEPAYVLGQKKKKKKKKKKKTPTAEPTTLSGHTDAVLSLAWNRNIQKIMGSASADKTVCLWDMSQCTCVHSLKHHRDKVQSIKWHPVESQSLLTGSFDKSAVVVDCRSPDVFKSWSLTGECEQVLWDHHSPYNFFVSTDDGVVSYFDVRTDSPVFKVDAHNQEVTGISLSNDIPTCFTTVSADEFLKVWSYKDNKPICILSRDMKMGSINFVSPCPDSPLTLAMGGQKDGLRMLNLLETTQGKEHFKSLVGPEHLRKISEKKETPHIAINNKKKTSSIPTEHQMETDHAAEALATLSIKKNNGQGDVIVKRKKKKKK